jgi:hypothetical protein
MAAGSELRFIGHNPAGGAMIVALLVSLGATAVTGWMLTTDAFWGSIAIQRLHSVLAHGLLLLVFIHLTGVAWASLRHNENLVRAMALGVKRAKTGRRRLAASDRWGQQDERTKRRRNAVLFCDAPAHDSRRNGRRQLLDRDGRSADQS